MSPRFPLIVFTAAFCLMSCSRAEKEVVPATEMVAKQRASEPVTETVPPKDDGFDPARVPVATAPLGSFPFVSLIEGYDRKETKYSKRNEYDRYEFFDGRKMHAVEGRLETIEAVGGTAGAIEIVRTYERLVKDLGGVLVFAGNRQDLWDARQDHKDKRHRAISLNDTTDQIGVYMVRTPERQIWVEAFVPGRWLGYTPSGAWVRTGNYYLTVLEKKPLEVRASLLPAAQLEQELGSAGRVALYVGFDFDEATIRAESRSMIDEIAKLMTNDPTLKLRVEGHTDNLGTADYNRKLSSARAAAVAGAVVAKGIDSSRLQPAGFGADHPVAENHSEQGRAKNRRVELVKL